MQALASTYGIKVDLPVFQKEEWDAYDGWFRDIEMNHRGFMASVLEPKCTLGLPSTNMSEEELRDMNSYFTEYIWDDAKVLVNDLAPIYKHIKLSEEEALI